jgi:hypothetical protein
MRNVFKKALNLHSHTFDKATGLVNIECSDNDDRQFLITELLELADGMDFIDYEIIVGPAETNLQIKIV